VHWWIGPATGAVIASAVTFVMVAWEWVENPGGIFRGESGTNWNFVFDTAISWFVPTLINATLIALAVHLAWIFVKKRRSADKQ
jgi:hypothetical protein